MKAYKIQVDPYDIEMSILDEKGEEKKKMKAMHPKFELPRILCNATIGSENRQPPRDFDLMEIGPIAQKIEQEKDIFVTVSEEQLKTLKKRIEFLSRFISYGHYEMFRRVLEAQPVDMIESTKGD